jgi:SAM-dependent methyltransferase
MGKETTENSKAWSKVYETTDFGNKYPTDGLVSLYYHFIKERLAGLPHPIKVLDFACSHGANAKFFVDLGFEVYGIDVSEKAVSYCVQEQGFDCKRFAVCDVLEEDVWISEMFGKFDLIVASECLYYFSQNDFYRLLDKFHECMEEGALIYANMHTWNHQLYREYQEIKPNDEGMVEIKTSGTAELPLWVKIVEDKEEMRRLFHCFEEVATVRSMLELESENETLHFIGRKRSRDKKDAVYMECL